MNSKYPRSAPRRFFKSCKVPQIQRMTQTVPRYLVSVSCTRRSVHHDMKCWPGIGLRPVASHTLLVPAMACSVDPVSGAMLKLVEPRITRELDQLPYQVQGLGMLGQKQRPRKSFSVRRG